MSTSIYIYMSTWTSELNTSVKHIIFPFVSAKTASFQKKQNKACLFHKGNKNFKSVSNLYSNIKNGQLLSHVSRNTNAAMCRRVVEGGMNSASTLLPRSTPSRITVNKNSTASVPYTTVSCTIITSQSTICLHSLCELWHRWVSTLKKNCMANYSTLTGIFWFCFANYAKILSKYQTAFLKIIFPQKFKFVNYSYLKLSTYFFVIILLIHWLYSNLLKLLMKGLPFTPYISNSSRSHHSWSYDKWVCNLRMNNIIQISHKFCIKENKRSWLWFKYNLISIKNPTFV